MAKRSKALVVELLKGEAYKLSKRIEELQAQLLIIDEAISHLEGDVE